MRKILTVLPLVGALGLIGCNLGASNVAPEVLLPQNSTQAVENLSSRQPHMIAVGEGEYLLASSESRGLVSFSPSVQTASESLQPVLNYASGGDIESFDWRQRGDLAYLLAFDKSESALKMFRLDAAGKLLPLTLDLFQSEAVESLCLYRDSRGDNQLYALLLDQSGVIQQWLLARDESEQWRGEKLRDIALGGELSSCVADDRSGYAYVVQQGVGVWQLSVQPESADERRPVDLMATFESFGGNLVGELGGVALHQNGLWLALPDSQQLARYALNQDFDQKLYALEGFEPQGVSVSQGQLWLGDESDSLMQFAWPETSHLPLQAATFSDHTAGQDEVDMAAVNARVETSPVVSRGDAADDPAVWINAVNTDQSLVLGTDKRRGLAVYDLQGRERQFIERGRLNNVDLRYGVVINNLRWDIAAATNRTLKTLDVFAIAPASGEVSLLLPEGIATDLSDPYGLCLYQPSSGEVYIFANDKDGLFEQWHLSVEDKVLQPKKLAEFRIEGQPEGCVADDDRGLLFFGEEDRGLWKLDIASLNQSQPQITLVDGVDNGRLIADVEGIGLYRIDAERGYLVVSSQGDDSYAIYRREGEQAFVGKFRIHGSADTGIDGSSETDGLDVTSAALGSAYPKGLLVVQDGRNRLPEQNQNFKLVSWADIEEAMAL